MTDERTDKATLGAAGAEPSMDAELSADAEQAAGDPASRRDPGGGGYSSAQRKELRRRRIRRVANAMIICAGLGLVGIILYFVITWQVASGHQDALRDELAADNPGLAAAAEGVSESDFFSVDTLFEQAAAVAALTAEGERQVAALKAAAEDYYRKVLRLAGKAVGEIAIPKLGVESVMVQGGFAGWSERYLTTGPGHWPETPMPGQGGSSVFSGHRSTYGAPFRKIEQLGPGDQMEVTMPYAIIRYTVIDVIIVKPEEVEVVADQGREMLSLVACHPLYGATERIIARAYMNSFVLLDIEQ